jgi:acyl-CoA thioesterase I
VVPYTGGNVKRAAMLVVFVVIACLGGASSARLSVVAARAGNASASFKAPAPALFPASIRASEPPKFIFLGDSLTRGLFASAEATTFRALLAEHFGATATRVAATGGNSADFLNSRAEIVAAQPDVVIIELGTDDQVDGHSTVDDLAVNLRTLVGFAREGNAACRVVMFSTWRGTGEYPAWNAAIRDVAHECGASYVSLQALYDDRDNHGPAGVPTIWPDIPGPGGIGFVTDYFHPNDAGHAAIAATAIRVLEDRTAPQTSDDAPGGWQARDTLVNLTSWDAGSGVDHIESVVDDGVWNPGAQAIVPAPCDHSGDGIHVIRYRAVDVALNVEVEKVCRVRIDTRHPTTDAPCSAIVARGRYVTLRYRIDDALPCGGRARACICIRTVGGRPVKREIFARVPVNTPLVWRFRCSLAEGTYRYYVRATDSAGNAQARTGSNRLIVK